VKFWLGLGIGVVLGGGAMYLATRHGGTSAPTPAPTVVAVATDAGAPPAKKRHRHHVGGGGGGTSSPGGADTAGSDDVIDPAIVLTDADKAMLTQGDDVSLGPSTVDMTSGGDDARHLEQGEINAGISGGQSALEECIGKSIAGADFASQVNLDMIVDGKGQVTKVRMQAPRWLFAHGLGPCLRAAAKRLSFAATGAPTKVSVPFPFS
jgi:hypothetical protein